MKLFKIQSYLNAAYSICKPWYNYYLARTGLPLYSVLEGEGWLISGGGGVVSWNAKFTTVSNCFSAAA